MRAIEKERKELQVEHEKKLLILTEREKVKQNFCDHR